MRGTWVWGRPEPDGVVAWARRHDVDELFLGVRADVAETGDLAYVRQLVRLARTERVMVSALGGDPAWVTRPEDAAAWAHAVLRPGLFDALHVDIEPWARDDWETRRPELVAGYLDVLHRVTTLSPLPVEVDVAFWLHEVRTAGGQLLDDAVAGLVDRLAVLSYRVRPTGVDSITEVATATLSTARRHRIPCRLAVETRALPDDPHADRHTFHGRGVAELDRALAAVDTALALDPSYAGLAVHDLEGWRAL